nr:hypothetical protein [uncultured Rhodopila sp.]
MQTVTRASDAISPSVRIARRGRGKKACAGVSGAPATLVLDVTISMAISVSATLGISLFPFLLSTQ